MEGITDINGNLHQTLTPCIHPLFWKRVLRNVVAEAYIDLETWCTLHSVVTDLHQLLSKHHDRISADKDLPTEL